ncbi:hypothetical protein [Brachybacterium sp.]|uniref:YveK family protein n=1 Tax=Brachybacterium sp. TaxID=1891286 RepID=UPI002ECFD707
MSTEAMWRILRDAWWILATGAVVGGLIGLLVLAVAPKHYEAESRVLIQPVASDAESLAVEQSLLRELLPTYIAVARSDASLIATSERLGGEPGVEALRSQLQFVADEDSPVIIITGTGSTGDEAAAVAGAGAETLFEAVEGGANGTVEASAGLLEEATAPTTPSNPDPAIVIPAGIIVGAITVLLALIGREGSKRHPRVLRRIESAAGAPVMGILDPPEGALSRAVAKTGLPTTAVGIRGRLHRLPYSTIALVHANSPHGMRISTFFTTAERSGARRSGTTETWAVPLSDQLSSLPEDAVAVLVVGDGCSSTQISGAARFSIGHGIPVIGCIVDPLGDQEQNHSLDPGPDGVPGTPTGGAHHGTPRRRVHDESRVISAHGGHR